MFLPLAFLLALTFKVHGKDHHFPPHHLTGNSLQQLVNSINLDTIWHGFKQEYDRSYPTIREELRRRSIFRRNLLYILQHNLQIDTSSPNARLGVSEFTDLTSEEFAARMGFRSQLPPRNRTAIKAMFRLSSNTTRRVTRDLSTVWVVEFNIRKPVPKRLDWRGNGIVSVPKNQGNCGNCWAHASAGAVEGVSALKTKKMTEVSVQQLVDCVRYPPYESKGCDGGYVEEAMDWAVEKGIASHVSYPTSPTGNSGTCKRSVPSVASIEMYALVMSEKDLEYALQYGPVVVGISASSPNMQHYTGGIIVGSCGSKPDHSVLVVGYDEHSWIVKNSWGTKWGEAGFFRVLRGKNTCSIASHILMALA